jgi:hypothetical protein
MQHIRIKKVRENWRTQWPLVRMLHRFEYIIDSNTSSIRTNYQSYHPVQTLLKLGAMLAYPGIVMLAFPGIVRWLYPQLSLEKCVKGGLRVEAALISHTKDGQVGILWIFKQLLVLL